MIMKDFKVMPSTKVRVKQKILNDFYKIFYDLYERHGILIHLEKEESKLMFEVEEMLEKILKEL